MKRSRRFVLSIFTLVAIGGAYSLNANASSECGDWIVFDSKVDVLGCGESKPVDPQLISKIKTEGKSISSSRHRGGLSRIDGLLSDLLFNEQDNLTDSALDSVLDWSTDIQTINRNIDDSNDSKIEFEIPFRVYANRKVYLNNLGTLSNPSKGGESLSKFTVISDLGLRVRPLIRGEIGQVSASAEYFSAGAYLRLIKQESSPSILVRKKSSEELALEDVSPAMKQNGALRLRSADQSKRNLAQRFFSGLGRAISKAFTPVSSLIRKIGQAFVDSDKGRVAVADPLSPLTKNTHFLTVDSEAITKFKELDASAIDEFNTDASSIEDDSILKVGDILNLTYYVDYGPKGELGLSWLHAKGSIKNKRNYLTRSVLKKENGKVRLTYSEGMALTGNWSGSLEERFGLILGASVRFRPAFYEVRTYGSNDTTFIGEISYDVDLKSPTARKAFDDVFRGVIPNFDSQNWKDALEEGSIVVEASLKKSLEGGKKDNQIRRISLQTGIYDINRTRTSSVISQKQPCDGEAVYVSDLENNGIRICRNEMVGSVSEERAMTRRVFFKDSETSKENFQSTIEIDQDGKTTGVNLLFATTFNDLRTKTAEANYYVEAIDLSTYRGLLLYSNDRGTYDSIVNQRTMPNRSWQFASARVQLKKEFTDKVLRAPESKLAGVLSDLYAPNQPRWTSRADIANFKSKRSGQNCVSSSMPWDRFRSQKQGRTKAVSCGKVADKALEFMDLFAKIKPLSAEDRAAELNALVKDERYRSAHILYIMLGLGKTAADFSADVKNGSIAYEVLVEGQDLDRLYRFHNGVVQSFSTRLSNNFAQIDVSTERFIRNEEIFSWNGRNYLLFDTQTPLKADDTINGYFYDFKKVISDDVIGFTWSEMPSPLRAVNRTNSAPLYTYGVELPAEYIQTLPKDDSLTIQFWSQDVNGVHKTETAEQKFSL
ncbi:MAG: hypothetical protein KDD25_00135 [Bdellovibrionales bacterium]|nr:hypothetical protein [Bdellovibrionales bacterium]